MIHPILIETDDETNNLVIVGDKFEKLLNKPKPILWKRGNVYLWVPIEKVRNAVKWLTGNDYYPNAVIFVRGDCVVLPKEAGDVIFKYNGHED